LLELDDRFQPTGQSFFARSDRDDVESWRESAAAGRKQYFGQLGLDIDTIRVLIAQDHNRTDRSKKFKVALLDNALRAFGLNETEAEELADAMFKSMKQTDKSWKDFCFGKH